MKNKLNFGENSKITRESWIDHLKFMACILITNSHCGVIYPLSYMAIGGGFGNAIFFGLQGYLLVNVTSEFIQWYKKRIYRLLPAVIIVSISDLIVNHHEELQGLTSALQTYGHILGKYWFCEALLLYYVVYYWILQTKENDNAYKLKKVKIAFIIWLCVYPIYYIFKLRVNSFFVELAGFSMFKVYFYFGVVLAGAYIRIQKDKITMWLKNSRNKDLLIMGGLCAGFIWGAEYAGIMLWNRGLFFQFLIHMGVFGFTVALMSVCMSSPNRFKDSVFIRLIASATLEIYLFQVSFEQIRYISVFPIRLIVFMASAIMGGIVIHELIRLVQKLVITVGEKVG